MLKRTRKEFVRDLKIGVAGIVLAHIVLIVMLAIFGTGCATMSAQQPATEIKTQETLRGLVRIQQMGGDCADQARYLRDIVKEIYFRNGLPEPAIIKLTPLAGSSICGFSQGMANVVVMPELGARNTAVAEVGLYWSAITERELIRAKTILASMKPL